MQTAYSLFLHSTNKYMNKAVPTVNYMLINPIKNVFLRSKIQADYNQIIFAKQK